MEPAINKYIANLLNILIIKMLHNPNNLYYITVEEQTPDYEWTVSLH